MNKFPLQLLAMLLPLGAVAQNETIDISGNNTSSSYISYDKSISLPLGKTLDVKMARYCYFSSTIAGKGTLNLYAGGERCYLGTAKGATWPNWTSYNGDIHIYPFPENSSAAGFYGVVLAHGGKSFSPENIDDALKSGKVNTSMQSNHVTLHQGATICCEANTAGAGFRIGELQTEPGSTLQGYMKNTRAAYYLLGSLGTNFTLAGTIAPSGYRDDTPLGIIKEGQGVLTITGNDNYLSGALRVLEGRVQVGNDRAEAEQKKLRGALGARPTDSEAIAYVFEQGVLGGTGSIGGTVDNYGTIEPGLFEMSGDLGSIAAGTLTIRNYAAPSKSAHLTLHPASVLRFKVFSATDHDRLDIGGTLKYSDMMQDFSTGSEAPIIAPVLVGSSNELTEGTELPLLTAQAKAGDWQFRLEQPEHHTWQLVEREADGQYTLLLRLVSLKAPDDPSGPDDPSDPDNPSSTMGAFYNDGIDDSTDKTALRTYAEKCGKLIGTALSTWKNDITNEGLAETKEAGQQFSLLEPENEMKMDALQPQRGEYTYWGADNLVSFAQRHQMNVRGHCLVWHMQQPQWLSSDGKKNDKNWSRQEALAIMKDHISNVMAHFKGKVSEWDVVNECLDDDQSIIRSNPDGYTLRQTVWQRAIGDDYIDSAFVFAHRADPSAVLYLNDYDVEHQGKAKSVAFRNLALRLQKAGIPIDGVGLQCHFSIGDVDSTKLDQTIRRFGEAGLKCVITELDMGTPSTSAKDLEEQARQYRIVTDVMLGNDNCPYMIIWGLKDNDSWRSGSTPLLYNSSLTKKPAWYAVRSALRHHTLTVPAALRPVGCDTIATSPTGCYDLLGRHFKADAALRPGLYIIGGKKTIIK
ncbi:MAG: endo-1,4-beta-xylanase [Prevotella sp.]|nr:endo-1,4-beta-xylanase [Prevotella sp.]